ncbi:putative trans-resveratrol di-O-methyltransferase-like [Capsicum annuum]|nr:putative trans-resveratrol di-O-methyltransferase-like [Capsicum annuum]KAF3642440.1 putative trans-resveratrol di-O-methyltransferase-like [Capsicum annuum]
MVTNEEGRSININEIFVDEYHITIHQDSTSNSQEISENERQWIHSLEKRRGYTGLLQKPKIQKVPKMHREIESNVRCYEPLVVSIGPFHRGKPELQLMEKHKELLAIQFADQDSTKERPEGVLPWLSTNSVSIDELYEKVKNIMPNVRECYDDELIKKYSHEEFAQIMLLDGCFILQYFHCIVTGNYTELKMKSHDIAFIRRDLFLLENQLPFEVLQVLMSCKFKNNEGMEMIKKFISSAHTKPTPPHGFIQGIKDFFLDLFGDTQKVMSFLGKICGEEGPPFTKQESTKIWLPSHLLELLKTHLIDPNAFSEGGCYLRGEWCSYRSAIELRRAGIRFRPGKSRRLSEVKFTSFHCSALLTLPPITVDDSTKSEFLNLVAYEACPDTPDDFGITSFLTFMDSLIDHAEDVKELRSKGILLNFLGSDQEVADLFNEIARDLVPNPHAYVDVKDQIEKHYYSKSKIWIAEWKNTHFTSPWTVFAFIAALFVIGLEVTSTFLAGIQTYYTVHPKGS